MTHARLTDELLHDLIVEPLPTLDICRSHQLAIATLRRLLESPEFQDVLDDLDAIENLRAPIRRLHALAILERVSTTEPTGATANETIRKAAAELIRNAKSVSPAEPSSEPPDPPPPTPDGPNTDPGEPLPETEITAQANPTDARTRGQAQCARHPTASPPPVTPAALIAAAGRPVSIHQLFTPELHPQPPPIP